MALSPQLLSILACPEDQGPLYLVDVDERDDVVLYNPRLRRTYQVRDDIPIMLIDESTALDEAAAGELEDLIARHGIEPTISVDSY